MNKIKKSLSVLLSLVMLFTTLCFFVLPETGIEANAAAGEAVSVDGDASAYNRVDDVIITVPETIYMKPDTGASKTGQYYVNNIVDTSGNVTLEKSNAVTAGKMYIYAPGATSVKYTVATVTGNAGAPTVTDAGTTQAFTSTGYFKKEDIDVSVANGLNATEDSTLKWTVTLYYGANDTTGKTYYAYSTLYSPYYLPVGVATRAKGYKYKDWEGNIGFFAASMAWVSGVHGFTANSDDGKYWIAVTDQELANESKDVTERGTYYVRKSEYAMVPLIYGVATAENNEKAVTNWIQASSPGDEIAVPTFRYFSLDHGGTSERSLLVADVSPVANITVDTSRYNNLNQIPNLTVGFNATDTQHAEEIYWYASDFTDIANKNDSADNGTAYFYNYTKMFKKDDYSSYAPAWFTTSGSVYSGHVSDKSAVKTGVEYDSSWNRSIVEGSSTYDYMFKGVLHTYGGDHRAYSINYVQLRATNVDKTELRNLVLQATSINKANYTSGSFGYYEEDLGNAGYVLGNPCATAQQVQDAVNRLKASRDGCGTNVHPTRPTETVPGLQKLVKFYNKDGNNTWYKDAYVTVGAAVEATVSPETPTRTGYTFMGWSGTAGGALMSPAKVNIYTASPALYAVWQANQYVLTFDNLFNFADWKAAGLSADNGTISDVTKTGFTVTATTSGTNDAYTNFTPWIEVKPNTTYRIEADLDFDNSVGGGTNEIFVHMKTADGTIDTDYLKEDGTVRGTEYYNSSGKSYIQFTTSADTATISFRFDVNNYGNVLKVDKIRLRCLDDGISYVPTQVVTYDSDYSVTTPTRTGYTFDSWRDAANNKYAGGKVTFTEDKALHSTWTPTPYTITLTDSLTGVEETLTYTIEDTSFALPSADEMQKESYTFTGWEVTSNSDGNWTVGAKTDGTLNKNYGDVTITAKYDEIYYTIKWVDWNGNLLKEEQVRYGTLPTKPATDPVKTGNAQYSYTFSGWGEITKAYEDKTYTAQYTEAVNTYTITWNTGSDVITNSGILYGTKDYRYNGDTPTKAADVQYTYTFDGWTIEGDTSGTIYDNINFPEITGNITFVAHFTAATRQYTVTWKDHNGNVLENGVVVLDYGSAIVPVKAPERTDDMYNITFIGWEDLSTNEIKTDFTGIKVTGNATYQAKYSSELKTYNITFNYKDKNGADKTYSTVVTHGTEFSVAKAELLKEGYADYYYDTENTGLIVSGEKYNEAFYHTHYKADWGNVPERITSAQTFTVEYVEMSNVGMTVVEYINKDSCLIGYENTQRCANCNFEYSIKEEPQQEHNFTELVSDSATCLERGEKTFRCSNSACDSQCTATYTQETGESPAKGHNITITIDGYAASCESEGLRSYKYCDRCRLYFLASDDAYSEDGSQTTERFIIPATNHKYDEGKITTKPTCTSTGVKTFTCINENCLSGGVKHTRTETVDMLSHSFTQHVEAKDADCFNAGNHAYKYCENCKKYFAEEDNNEHSSEGKDSADYFVIPKEEHVEGDPVQKNIIASDCETNAEYDNVWYCTKCNTVLRTEHITGAPLGHKFDKKVIDPAHFKTAATCSSYAVYYYECSRQGCNQIAKPGENTNSFVYEAVFEYTEGGYDYTNHSTDVTTLVGEKAATCCETGYTGDRVCVACNRVVEEGSEIATNNDHSAYEPHKIVIKTLVEATCIKAEVWEETPWCSGCNKAAGETVTKTGKVNALNHVGETKEITTITADATCCSTEKYKVETVCLDCNKVIVTKTGEGGKNASNHSGGTYTVETNYVAATCTIPRSWDEITFCNGCDAELDKEKITLSVDPERHVGETYTADEDIKEATCTTVKTWNEVTYCADCKEEISRAAKIGELNPEKHSGTTVRLNEKEATCKEVGYTGDRVCVACNRVVEEGTVIPKHNNHTAGEPVKENEIPATETSDGKYDMVVYCTVCETELSRETIEYHIERTITFVLKDSKVIVKAYRGDEITPPETPEVISADGFYHLFLHWDKKIKPVTGDETYTAIYTEPCNYTELDRLEGVLNEIVYGGLVDPAVLAIYKEDIDAAFAAIKEVNKERRFRDVSEQRAVTAVTDMLDELVYTICPDYGAKLVIESSSVLYTGRALDIRAVKMPAGNTINDADWTSSDENIVFFSNGKLYAIGTGTVTITAERGILKATKTITVIEGGNTRGVNFTSLEAVEFIVEDYYSANDSAVLYWTDDQPLRFRVNLTQTGLFDYYTVYINGVPAEMSKDGYYVIPANYGDAKVTIIGEVENDNDGNSGTTSVSKWSFWEWLLSFFRKIGDFFRGLFS